MNNNEQLTCDECGRTETECQAQATNVVNPITQWIGYRGVMCDDCYYEKYASDEDDDDDAEQGHCPACNAEPDDKFQLCDDYDEPVCDDCYWKLTGYITDDPEPEMSAAEWLKSQNLDQLQAYVDSFCKICKLQKEYDILGSCECK
tara:strand:+ start:887 stop:1324 length:438 start_codon:yes stop_codon:yes gene_type:complete